MISARALITFAELQRPAHENHVWSYDFMSARTHDGRGVRILNLIDEYTRESLLIRAEQR
jgi:putative transposase